MALQFDPEVADVLARMGGTEAFQPPRDDVEGRRAFWEPILAASSGAQPFPEDVKTSDRYVSAGGVPMLSVEYRRAPEHPFPVPIEDGYAALNWLHEHAAELGVDADRIGVMGDSAGGGMAAAVSILARERGGPRIARQLLVMPMPDDRTGAPDPHLAPFVYNHGDLVAGWRAFLGDAVGTPGVPPTAAPACRTSSTPSPSPPASPGARSPIGSECSSRSESTPFTRASCHKKEFS
ncbi:alpha/beta hydrolase fold domain-containing protein [Amycolatopsis sp. NPDC051106]|uniref:alpha/beta hydrolase fold domain-containing protein n=1 Tax=unclassified Amycolatopsis TaxID=2618356 RepID=UPI00342BF519